MASLKDFGKLGTAILQPLMQHRFRIEFYKPNMSIEASKAISRETVNCKVDFANKTISLDIQQPAACVELVSVISDFTDGPAFNVAIRAVLLDGCEGILGTLEFSQLKTLQHSFDLDYSGSGVVEHKIVFKFGHMETK